MSLKNKENHSKANKWRFWVGVLSAHYEKVMPKLKSLPNRARKSAWKCVQNREETTNNPHMFSKRGEKPRGKSTCQGSHLSPATPTFREP